MEPLERNARWGIKFFAALFALAIAAIAARAFQLQVMEGEAWRERAERQHQRVVSLTPPRGGRSSIGMVRPSP